MAKKLDDLDSAITSLGLGLEDQKVLTINNAIGISNTKLQEVIKHHSKSMNDSILALDKKFTENIMSKPKNMMPMVENDGLIQIDSSQKKVADAPNFGQRVQQQAR